MSRTLRVVFAGTPAFALPALDALLESEHSVVAVYTQPDRRAGRGRHLTASPVKQRALTAGIPVRQPVHLNDPDEQQALEALAPDVMVVVAYGLLLPPAVLDLPELGCINIHASLLPRWRGAAPIQRAILAGDRETGATIMQMNVGLDTGPVLAQKTTAILFDDTSATLHDRLAKLGADALLPVLDELADGAAQAEPQSRDGVTYAQKLTKVEARINWHEPAEVLVRRVQGLQPWPVAETQLDGKQLRIWAAIAMSNSHDAVPGTIVAADEGFDVATGNGCLRVHTVQRAGGKRMDAAAFARGVKLVGKRLD